MESIEQLIRRITEDGIITESELRELHQNIMWDGQVTPTEKKMFKDLLRKIDQKELRVR